MTVEVSIGKFGGSLVVAGAENIQKQQQSASDLLPIIMSSMVYPCPALNNP